MKKLPIIAKEDIIPDIQHQNTAEDRAMLATFMNVDFQRVRFWCLAGAISAKVPRRLGRDATPDQLAYDKRVSRKVCSQYRDVWKMFAKADGFPDPPNWSEWPVTTNDRIMVRVGATVIWDRQIDYLINVVHKRMIQTIEFEELARYARLASWYYRHSNLLDQEFNALHRIKDTIMCNARRPRYAENRAALDAHNAAVHRDPRSSMSPEWRAFMEARDAAKAQENGA